MQVRMMGSPLVECPTLRGRLEQKVRLGVGSWAGRIKRLDLRIREREEAHGGLNAECRIAVYPPMTEETTIAAVGANVDAAVQNATRRLVRKLKRQAAQLS